MRKKISHKISLKNIDSHRLYRKKLNQCKYRIGEMRISISQQYRYIVRIPTIESPDVRFVNMGILFLFNEIRLEVAGDVIDRVRNPGIMSVMKGYVTYNTGQSKALENGG
jgi:hypothetical protein